MRQEGCALRETSGAAARAQLGQLSGRDARTASGRAAVDTLTMTLMHPAVLTGPGAPAEGTGRARPALAPNGTTFLVTNVRNVEGTLLCNAS